MTGPSTEARLAGAQIFAWWHIFDPVSMGECHADLVEGYVEAVTEHAAACREGDRQRAARLAADAADLHWIIAESTRGRDMARARWILTLNRPWPLTGMR